MFTVVLTGGKCASGVVVAPKLVVSYLSCGFSLPCAIKVRIIMDETSLRILLDQTTSTTKMFVELMFNKLSDTVEELKRSLEFTQAENDSLKQRVTALEASQTRASREEASLQSVSERIRIMEDQARSKNLRITGVPEDSNENQEQSQHKAKRIIVEKLGHQDVKITEAYRVGKPGQQSTNKPRPIIAQLSSRDQKIKCLKSSNKLKGTTIFISEDVSKATQDIRDSKLGELKEKRAQGMIAYFSGAKIVCRQRPNHGVSSGEGRMLPPRGGRNGEEGGSDSAGAGGSGSTTEVPENTNSRPLLPASNPSVNTVMTRSKAGTRQGENCSSEKVGV